MVPERRVDTDTRDRIDVIADNIEHKFKILWRWILAFGLFLSISLFINGLFVLDNRGRADRIQASRRTNMYNSCREVNARNEDTKKVLHRVIQQSINSGKITEAGGNASEQFTTLLINALAPHRNCKKFLTGSLTVDRTGTSTNVSADTDSYSN